MGRRVYIVLMDKAKPARMRLLEAYELFMRLSFAMIMIMMGGRCQGQEGWILIRMRSQMEKIHRHYRRCCHPTRYTLHLKDLQKLNLKICHGTRISLREVRIPLIRSHDGTNRNRNIDLFCIHDLQHKIVITI